MADIKGERLEKETKTKEVYYYYDDVIGIKQLSREVIKHSKDEIHYPRGFEGGDKYKHIRRIIYKGFKGKLPVGAIKSVAFGWGFTKILNPFAYYIDETYSVEEVIIEKDGIVLLDLKTRHLHLSDKALSNLHTTLQNIYSKNKEEVSLVLMNSLHGLFPAQVAKPKKAYVANALASSLSTWGNSIDEFSDEDKEAIKDLFEKLSTKTGFLTQSALGKTKQLIDNKYIQLTLQKFQKLMSFPKETNALEKKWQLFMKENSWVLSSIFAQPVILYKDEAYVGGKTINNADGKFSDFLIKNSLSENISFLEIKTHKTALLEKKPYRGTDVFSSSGDLNGCIAQVLNQRDNFQKEFYSLKGKQEGKQFESFNSRCVVLIGSSDDLSPKQRKAFELFRSNSRDVEMLTFDELAAKIQALQEIMRK